MMKNISNTCNCKEIFYKESLFGSITYTQILLIFLFCCTELMTEENVKIKKNPFPNEIRREN